MTAHPTTARRRLTMAFRTPTGAIDLASIMVGVIVLAVITLGAVAATVFAVIPWAQDNAAVASLRAYQTAQSVARATEGRFLTNDELVEAGYLPEKIRTAQASAVPDGSRGMSVPTVKSETSDDGGLIRAALNDTSTCYVAATTSGTGAVFYTTSESPEVNRTDGASLDTSWCAPFPVAASALAVADHFVQVSSGDNFNSAIDNTGHIWTWGRGDYSDLGDGTSGTNVRKPNLGMISPTQTFNAVDSAGAHSLAIDTDGHLWAWGDNRRGQLGDGTLVERATPTAVNVPTGLQFEDVATGNDRSLAVDSTGQLWEWGNPGPSATWITRADEPTPHKVAIGQTFKQVSVSFDTYAALDTDNHIWTWGTSTANSLGNGRGSAPVPDPAMITPSATYTSVDGAAIDLFTIAIGSDGLLRTWGNDSWERLGNGQAGSWNSPGIIGPTDRTFTDTSAGYMHGFALDSADQLWAWGQNTDGEFGNGTVNPAAIPIQVAVGQHFRQVSSGNHQTIALDQDGQLWAWGLTVGQTGDVVTTTPVKIAFPTDSQ